MAVVALAASASLLPAATASAVTTTVAISELRVEGGDAPQDEFVELVNVSQGSIDISGWSLVFVDAACEGVEFSHEMAPGTVLRAGQHYLVAGAGYTGPVQADDDVLFSGELLEPGGGSVRLVAPGGPVDTVGYGDAEPECSEGDPAAEPSPEGSAERIGGRRDSDDNSADFVLRSVSDPDNTSTIDDVDQDGFTDDVDNCPALGNPDQSDVDRDGGGDACDADDDGDGISDTADACRLVPGSQPDGCPPRSTAATDPQAPRPGPLQEPIGALDLDGGPEILIFRLEPSSPRVGESAEVVVRAVDPGNRVTSIIVDFGERFAVSGQSSCQQPSFSSAFRPGRKTTFRVPHEFLEPGLHVIVVTVVAGGCEGLPRVTRQAITVEVLPAAGATATRHSSAGAGARAAQTGTQACRDADLQPSRRNLARVRAATLCLINAERLRKRVRPLRSSRALLRLATGHSRDMLRRSYFAHAHPGGPVFRARLNRARYRATAGENIGFDVPGTASRVVAAWMGSPPHRANILSRRFRFLGVGVLVDKPIDPRRPGATYTANFGARAR